ncbi:hypothetical protein AB205_0100060, partial [Aquarana catesbeiana]
ISLQICVFSKYELSCTKKWEYIEGHKDLYKDIMMENRLPLTSPDGSSNRNPPERCPRPLYSRDSTQEHQEIPQEDQGKSLYHVKDEAEEMDIEGDEPCKEDEISPKIRTDPENTKHTQRDIKSEEEELHIIIKEEEEEKVPPEISTDPGDTRDTRRDIKIEEEELHIIIKEEEEEKVSPEISTDPGGTREMPRDIDEEEEKEDEEKEDEVAPVKIEEDDMFPEIGTGIQVIGSCCYQT